MTMKRKRDDVDFNNFARPSWEHDAHSQDLVFQLLECEDASKDKADSDASLIRLHGLSEDGHSLILLVRGFRQYIYFPVTENFSEADLDVLRSGIESNVKTPVAISELRFVEREPLEYYRRNPERYQRYVQIFVEKPTDINPIANVLSKGDELAKLITLFNAGKLYSSQVYETGLSYDMRFMTDLGLVGCGWVKVPSGAYKRLPSIAPHERVSGVFECRDFSKLIGLSPNSNETNDEKTAEWSKLAPMRCMIVTALTVDPSGPIKPAAKNGSTESATTKKGKTSKITASPKKMATSRPGPFVAAISLGLTTSPLTASDDDQSLMLVHGGDFATSLDITPGARVIHFATELVMLEAFRKILLEYDPDVVSGYDITSEALPTIMMRALELGAPKDYINLARCSHTPLKTKCRQIYTSSSLRKERRLQAATSNREHTELGCIGRLILDLRTVIEREERLRTYSLHETSEAIGGRKLEKLSDTVIASLYASKDDGERTRFADYVFAELWANLNLLRRHASLVTYIELSRVTGLNFEDVVSRGQMRRFWSQLFRFCGKRGVIVPGWSRGGEQMTQSALNYMPQTGYDTENPVIVLDFKSLYPSILIARNLCFSTEVQGNESIEEPHWTGFGGARFVDRSVKEGVVPAILKHFLAERARVRQLMKQTQDVSLQTVLDGRQRALKVVANAVYGFMGARESRLQNLAIADGTISEGAAMLELVKQEIERRYNSEGLRDVCEVVYGDTDSVFVKLFGKSVKEAIEMGERISREVSEVWPDPIQLEFEKVLFPSLLQNRKRYAGLLWTTADSPREIDIKGIEANRRDAVPVVGKVIGDVLQILFPQDRNNGPDQKISQEDRAVIIERVKQSVKGSVGQILNGELDVGNFIMTKGLWLGSEAADYSGKQPHISVIDKMRGRDSGLVFKDGERISYVFIQAAPNSKGFEKAEDPVYAIEKGLLLDYQYYVDHTVHNPLQRILELFLPAKEIEALFKSTVKTKVAVKSAGVMGAFLSAGKKSLARCDMCGDTCETGRKLCAKHSSQAHSRANEKLERFTACRARKRVLEETCHDCMRSKREILCTNMDCDVFFKRKQAQDELVANEEDLVSFVKAEQVDLTW
ncbi:hypothetical protein PYCC9005_001791 [Savitreella phatthalungensis]